MLTGKKKSSKPTLEEKTPLEIFQVKAERARQRVVKRQNERNMQEECLKVLELVNNKLDEKEGSSVSIIYKNYGKFMVDDEEIIISKKITMDEIIKLIDMIDAFERNQCTNTIEAKVEVWFA